MYTIWYYIYTNKGSIKACHGCIMRFTHALIMHDNFHLFTHDTLYPMLERVPPTLMKSKRITVWVLIRMLRLFLFSFSLPFKSSHLLFFALLHIYLSHCFGFGFSYLYLWGWFEKKKKGLLSSKGYLFVTLHILTLLPLYFIVPLSPKCGR